MKVCVYGAGAIGGHLAARLAKGGAQVSLVARGAHLAAIRDGGLVVHAHDGTHHSHPQASAEPAELGPQDAVIVTVKSPALPAVAAGIAPLLGPDTPVAFVMNGIPWWYFDHDGGAHEGRRLPEADPGDALRHAIGVGRTIGGVVYSATEVIAPGVVRSEHGNIRLILGEPDGRVSDRARAISALMEAGGIPCPVSPDIRTELWSKLLGNLASGPLCVLAGLGVRDITAVTLGFQEFEGLSLDEAPLAAEVAARYGARHIVRTVDRAEFERDLPALLDAMDLPTVDGINTWFVAKAAHEAGIKVALSGLGADECFGGYPSFTDVPRSVHWLRPVSWLPGLGALARRGLSGAIAAGLRVHPKTAGVLQYGGNWAGAYLLRRSVYMPWELDDVLDPALVEEGLRRLKPLSRIAAAIHSGDTLGDFDRVSALETSLYMRNQLLRDADWAGMSHGIEIRVPFVDPFFLAALPSGPVLAGMNAKDAIAGVPNPPLPDSVRHRRKTGFSTPHGRWLRDAAGAPRQQGIDLSAASRAWALKVWRAGWTGPATV